MVGLIMEQWIRALRAELREARTFEDTAGVVLRAMLRAAAEAVDASPYRGRGRMLRAMAHLRSGQAGVRGLWLEPWPPQTPAAPGPEVAYLPSATALRWVAEHGASVAIDVELGLLRPRGGAAREAGGDGQDTIALGSSETRDRLLGRDATHVWVVPLRAPGGDAGGMVSLEAACQSALGRPFVWDECADVLELIADIAAPHLLALPPRPIAPPAADRLLPVVGAATAGLVQILSVFARQEETLLVMGATGVGKSRLARLCHERSRRAGRTFEVIDFLTVPEELQLAELFGWRRGAFTGAVKDNPGAVARAEGGTLFIDEIDKLSLAAQAGLLRLIEERVYRPAGEATGDRRADVRFVIGTNVDLHAAVRAGRFREDLYYRIHVLPVRVPALSERADEIPGWVRYMLARRHAESGSAAEASVGADAERVLSAHPWPGNLRQLDNIVRRAYALSLVGSSEGAAVAIERHHVERALEYEAPPDDPGTSAALWGAARAFVREAERRAASGTPPALDLCTGFTGLVLAEAIARAGSREEAFRLLGRADLLESRNHHRVLLRELDRAEALLGALGLDARPLAALRRS